MKVIKSKADPKQTITLRLSASVIQAITEVANKNEVSRQELVEAILQRALEDKTLIITLS